MLYTGSLVVCTIFTAVLRIDSIKITEDSLPIVKTNKGLMQGTIIKTDNGNKAYAFQNIPFAEPPTGKLRFKKPVPKKPWKETLIANKYGPGCLQMDLDPGPFRATNYSFDEDCLTINVIAPVQDLTSSELKKYPVMFYIFPGANVFGSPQVYPEEPIVENFVSRGLVFVLVDYRVDGLAFWTTGTQDAPGNLYLWDMILGLQWVQDEIGKFGGDPNMVTLQGCSSSAETITLLNLSPQSSHLFQQGIMISGSGLTPGAVLKDDTQIKRSEQLANHFGCNKDSEWNTHRQRVVECMQKVDGMTLLVEYEKLQEDDPVIPGLKGSFPYVDGPGGVIPEHPALLAKKRRPIRVVTGDTLREMTSMLFTTATPANIDIPCESYSSQYATNNTDAVIAACKYRYADQFKSDHPDSDHAFWNDQLGAAINDPTAFATTFADADSLRAAGSPGVFVYSYDYVKRGQEGIGPFHASDLQPMYQMKEIVATLDERDFEIGRINSELYSDFAKTGSPTPPGSPYPKWTSLKKPTYFSYYSIDLKPSMKPFFHYDGVEFWNSIVPYLDRFGSAKTTTNIAQGVILQAAVASNASTTQSTPWIILGGFIAVIALLAAGFIMYNRRTGPAYRKLVADETFTETDNTVSAKRSYSAIL